MNNVLLIGAIVLSLSILLASVPIFKIYHRTGLKGSLFSGIGYIFVAIGLSGIAFSWYIINDIFVLNDPSRLFLLIIIFGVFIIYVGFAIENTKESGLWKEICDKTTYGERFTGNVPFIRKDKIPPPIYKRREMLIFGSSLIGIGILILGITILYDISFSKGLLLSSSVFLVIFGLLFVVFSLAFLDEDTKKDMEHKNN